jgi:phosphoglycerate kinase
VTFVDDCIGETVEAAVDAMKDKDIVLLQNLRYYGEETENNPKFSAELARLGDVYVNDAFGTAHRAHASTVGVTGHISPCAAGFLMKKEIDYLGGALSDPERPFVAILGGAKISDKINIISNLLHRVEYILIGGGMSFTFLKAQGKETGKSLLEADKVVLAKELLAQGKGRIILPVDCFVSDFFDFQTRQVGALVECPADAIPQNGFGLDIGPGSVEKFRSIILSAKTVVWNGPMGVFEIGDTAKGTYAIANALAEVTADGATTIVGGGDSASAIHRIGMSENVSHVSTGGGASLEFMEGKVLPGVAALTDA